MTNEVAARFIERLSRTIARDMNVDELYIGQDAGFTIGEDGTVICEMAEAEAVLIVRGRPERREAAISHLLAELELRSR